MFDFFCNIDFKNNNKLVKHINFNELHFYDKIKKIEQSINLDKAKFFYLERDINDINYYESSKIHFFIYGTVFSNNNYYNLTQEKPSKLGVKSVSEFFEKFNLEIVNYIKGSFVILIYNEIKNELILITDRHNVLPLYYFYDQNSLVVSSITKLILRTGLVPIEIDEIALVEQLLFDYLLEDRTYFKNIKQTLPAAIYIFNKDGIKINRYWDVENFYNEKLLPRYESLELLSEQLFNNVYLYASDRKKILVSLTGGFDGRTNVAMIRKNTEDFLCYSYGKPGSKQIRVPQIIANKLKINYRPIILDNDFENSYIEHALRVSEFSNGTAPIGQANLSYAFNQLSEYSDVTISGLFGSEVLRPIYNYGIQINDHSERLFLSEKVESSLLKSAEEIKAHNFIHAHIIDRNIEYIIEWFKKNYFERYKNYDKLIRFFFFIINEGIRKYFMQEIQVDRLYVYNRFPYFDQDFLDLLYQTPFAGMYNGFLGKSKVKRRKGQLLYAHIIRKYNPELGKIVLDRGYKPNDLLLPFPSNYIKIGIGVYKYRLYLKRHGGNDTFDITGKWNTPVIKYVLDKQSANDFFSDGMFISFKNKTFLKNELKYNHLVSLKNFLSEFFR